MKHLNKLFLTLFLFPLFLHAQDNFKPGLVVNLKGDTLRGAINYREWENNPKSISFQSANGIAPVKLSVNDIKYFNVSVGYLAEYQRYEGPITMNNIEINHLFIGRDTSMKQDTIFLKVVQRGKNLVLYSYSDNIKIRYFIADGSGGPAKELLYRVYYNSSEENGADRTVYENTWQRQFYQIANKTNTLTDALKTYISKSEYREQDIVYIAGEINGISAEDTSKNNLTKHSPVDKVLAIAGIILVIVGCVLEFNGHYH